jgi:hypothetical protein
MKLTRVTITGADDKTDRAELTRLTAAYPFVEWGILVSARRAGESRYPSQAGIDALLPAMQRGQIAFHVCGNAARKILAGTGPAELSVPRIQINGFSQHVAAHAALTPFGQWLSLVRGRGVEVILQVQHERALSVARLLTDVHPNVSALWDESGGRGLTSSAWPEPPPGLRLGYAGGLGPDNIARRAEELVKRASPAETWLDMESCVRTDDELDLGKVRRVLAEVAPYVHAAQTVLS